MGEDSKIKDTVEVVKGVVEAVPIYDDLAQPALREIGTALATVAKTLHVVLSPLEGMIWSYERLKSFLTHKVAPKLAKTPAENFQTPAPNIAVPLLEAVRYCGESDSLSDLFASLLASSIDKEKEDIVHPSYVEIIKQLSSDEAKMIRFFGSDLRKIIGSRSPMIDIICNNIRGEGKFVDILRRYSWMLNYAGVDKIKKHSEYFANLERLGLISFKDIACTKPRAITRNGKVIKEVANPYDPFYEEEIVNNCLNMCEFEEGEVQIVKYSFQFTDFGRSFCIACLFL